MPQDNDLIVLFTPTGRVVKTRAELELLAKAGILPSQLGYEDESKLIYNEDSNLLEDSIEY